MHEHSASKTKSNKKSDFRPSTSSEQKKKPTQQQEQQQRSTSAIQTKLQTINVHPQTKTKKKY
jgi:hypothetical protein